MATSANEIQVGGSHYKSAYQHWDLVNDLDLDYFQAQITRYVTRWRKKNGVEDVQKAIHYTNKLYELLETGKRKFQAESLPEVIEKKITALQVFFVDNDLTQLERTIFSRVVFYNSLDQLNNLKSDLGKLLILAKEGR